VDAILYDAAAAGASDVHIETGPVGARVRYRIDGQLHTVRSYRSGDFAAVVARLKVMSRVNATERRLPQDGRFSFDSPTERFDVRSSFLPCHRGESVAIRLLSTAADTRSVAELGLCGADAAAVEGIDLTSGGLIVVAGPTGSGKTTTVHALLRRYADGTRNVLTVEDPVEYRLAGVTQVQVHRELGLGFDDALRRALRHDPDILMVGEIRDAETASLAVRGALSGHPVFATVHAPDTAAIDARLENLGVPRHLLREVIAARMSQRLLRRVCPACATVARPKPGEAEEAARQGVRLVSLRTGTGCEDCRGTGYRGRRGVFHVVSGSYRGPGLAAAAWRAVARGETTPTEVARAVEGAR
jgi:type II secretory ATPase GspE/PulE/Tfp pilus assembly ATPase PilB-like protein